MHIEAINRSPEGECAFFENAVLSNSVVHLSLSTNNSVRTAQKKQVTLLGCNKK
jgi:hypothetical protein